MASIGITKIDDVYCMCDPRFAHPRERRLFTDDFISLFVEKNSDGTRNLRLKGNELQMRIKQRVRNIDLTMISTYVQCHPEIIDVDLAYNPINDKAFALFADRVLMQSNNIRHLNLSGCNLTHRTVRTLISTGAFLVLKSLRLTGNKLGVQGADALQMLLIGNEHLEELEMDDTCQTVDSVPYICSALRQDIGANSALRILDLSNIIPSSMGYQTQPMKVAQHIYVMLQMNSTLIELHLEKCTLDGHCIEQLIKGLRRNKSLLFLDLGYNRMANYGAELISDWLKTAPPLTGINIAGNGITESGARALSFGIPYSRLRLLDISQNAINDQGLSELMLTMKKKQRMRLLYLYGNEIGPKTKKILIRHLLAKEYHDASVDFYLYESDEGTKISTAKNNEYKQLHYSQLLEQDVRELRIRRNLLPGDYCRAHAKMSFSHYETVMAADCKLDPTFDPRMAQAEASRRKCAEKEAAAAAEKAKEIHVHTRRSRKSSKGVSISYSGNKQEVSVRRIPTKFNWKFDVDDDSIDYDDDDNDHDADDSDQYAEDESTDTISVDDISDLLNPLPS